MDKIVVLAVAGTGKTYYTYHNVDPTKRNFMLAFTHENMNSIQRELCATHGRVPELATVATFGSFVYHHFALPYEPGTVRHFRAPDFISHGICTVGPPPMRIPVRDGRIVPNPHCFKEDSSVHHITKRSRYYCATLSKLVLQVKHNRESLMRRAAT